eukprot:4172820-Pleurochrysis_carterae.AAC.2
MGARFHVIAMDEAATAQMKRRARSCDESISMMPRPQPAWHSLRATNGETRWRSPCSSARIHETINTSMQTSQSNA